MWFLEAMRSLPKHSLTVGWWVYFFPHWYNQQQKLAFRARDAPWLANGETKFECPDHEARSSNSRPKLQDHGSEKMISTIGERVRSGPLPFHEHLRGGDLSCSRPRELGDGNPHLMLSEISRSWKKGKNPQYRSCRSQAKQPRAFL